MIFQPVLHPLDAGLLEIGAVKSGLSFPPRGWFVTGMWGCGYILRHRSGLVAIIDCSQKEDDRWWVHVSVSRAKSIPTHDDMALAKTDFLGDRYAYSVWPSRERYVNIHPNCLHLWALVDKEDGRVLPEFSDVLPGVGMSI